MLSGVHVTTFYREKFKECFFFKCRLLPLSGGRDGREKRRETGEKCRECDWKLKGRIVGDIHSDRERGRLPSYEGETFTFWPTELPQQQGTHTIHLEKKSFNGVWGVQVWNPRPEGPTQSSQGRLFIYLTISASHNIPDNVWLKARKSIGVV